MANLTSFEPFPSISVSGIDLQTFEQGGLAPSNVIRTDQNWRIHLEFQTSGQMSQYLKGFWQIEAYVDAYGASGDIEVGEKNIPVLQGDPASYSVDLNIPSGMVKPAAGEDSTLVELAVAVTYRWPDQTPGPMAGFVEGVHLQFYTP